MKDPFIKLETKNQNSKKYISPCCTKMCTNQTCIFIFNKFSMRSIFQKLHSMMAAMCHMNSDEAILLAHLNSFIPICY